MSDTLLLNQDYRPISILPLSVIGWQHAVKLMFLKKVHVLETYPDRIIRSEHLQINIPSVCVTTDYFKFKKTVKFSRYNMYLRDLFQCQYCEEVFDYDELTIDHVVPRASGGKTEWTNCCTACKPCNHRKGDKLMRPKTMPYRPEYFSLINKLKSMPFHVKHESWNKYLGYLAEAA